MNRQFIPSFSFRLRNGFSECSFSSAEIVELQHASKVMSISAISNELELLLLTVSTRDVAQSRSNRSDSFG
jgi:hypothetical protein